ncbi:PH domain-containing protein [Candidatus Raskinella chloraquaticus]|uniref:YdbS-like PH domain-containing protein n=1 Tax=Candidatus Raskinella chloraquaticus TaxID=1951219 RepID=A0A1W9I5G9_9HYPH|nr:MAG: hypothetical protein A4S15_03550 [Proteobacteria bacterium SG_bin8]
MADYVNSVLLRDEKIEYQAFLHWIIFVNGLFLMVLGAIVSQLSGFLASQAFDPRLAGGFQQMIAYAGVGILVIGLLVLITAWIRFRSTEIVVTNRRFIVKTGVISRHTHEIFLNRVEAANIEQSVVGRILDYGTVFVRGTGGGINPIAPVVAPRSLQRYLLHEIDDRLREERGGPAVSSAEGMRDGN